MCLWVCGSAGSVGLRGLWGLWGARKEGNRNEKGSKRAETESAGPKGAFRRFSEVPSTTTSLVFFMVLAILGAVRGRLTESGWESRVELQQLVRRTNTSYS